MGHDLDVHRAERAAGDGDESVRGGDLVVQDGLLPPGVLQDLHRIGTAAGRAEDEGVGGRGDDLGRGSGVRSA
ncbi:hypothetical protein [Streptomyces sp. NPDC054946]